MRLPEILRITLTDMEIVDALIVARGRYQPKEDAGLKDRFETPHLGWFRRTLIGVESEMAVARHYGLEIDREMYLYGNIGPDMYYHGLGLEVKCSQTSGGDYILKGNDPGVFRADVGVLTNRIGSGVYDIRGIIGKERFREVCEFTDYGYGPRVIAKMKYFSPPETLDAYLPG